MSSLAEILPSLKPSWGFHNLLSKIQPHSMASPAFDNPSHPQLIPSPRKHTTGRPGHTLGGSLNPTCSQCLRFKSLQISLGASSCLFPAQHLLIVRTSAERALRHPLHRVLCKSGLKVCSHWTVIIDLLLSPSRLCATCKVSFPSASVEPSLFKE